MEARLSQVNIRSGERFMFSGRQAHLSLGDSLNKINAGLFDQLQGPIRVPATEEHAEAIAYLVPLHAAAQDVFGNGTAILMLRPVASKNGIMDLVRLRFAVDVQDARRITRLIGGTNPRFLAALLRSHATVEMIRDRLFGSARMRQEEKLMAFLSELDSARDAQTPAKLH